MQDLENILLSEMSQAQKDKHMWFYTYVDSKVDRLVESKNRIMLPGADRVAECLLKAKTFQL
jgi:hypothetical protein